MANPDPAEIAAQFLTRPPVGSGDVEQLVKLANKLTELGCHSDAVALLDTALRLSPGNVTLAACRKQTETTAVGSARATTATSHKRLNGTALETRDSDDLLTQHFSGLGEYFYELGDHDQATRLFELARARNRYLHRPAVFLAKIAVERNDSTSAVNYLEEARRTNPFSQEISSLLGTVYHACGDHARALDATIDAMLLTGETEVEESLDFGDRIRSLWAELEATSPDDLGDIVRARSERVYGLRERLSKLLRESPPAVAGVGSIVATHPSHRPDLAPYRRFRMLEDLADVDLEAIATVLNIRTFKAGESIFAEGDDSNMLYLVARGSIQIRKVCRVGDFLMHTLREGDVAGRINFLDGRPHAAHAFAGDNVELYAFPRSKAEDILGGRRHVAVKMLLYFWRTLAQHIRESNQLLKSVMQPGAVASAEKFLDEKRRADAEQFLQECNLRIAQYRQRGLDSIELRLLRSLAGEESFGPGQLIFAEGAIGDKLYIVTAGQVQIARKNQGRDEVVAVLEPGEVFGEMALVDSQPRSASARSLGETVAIAIHKDTVDLLVQTDQESAQQFISLICRILAKRLREIDETVIKWRVMAGLR